MTNRRSLFSIIAGLLAGTLLPEKVSAATNSPMPFRIVGFYPPGWTSSEKVQPFIYQGDSIMFPVKRWLPLGEYAKFDASAHSTIPRGLIRTTEVFEWIPSHAPSARKIVREELMWSGQQWIDANGKEAQKIFYELCPDDNIDEVVVHMNSGIWS